MVRLQRQTDAETVRLLDGSESMDGRAGLALGDSGIT